MACSRVPECDSTIAHIGIGVNALFGVLLATLGRICDWFPRVSIRTEFAGAFGQNSPLLLVVRM